MKNELSLIAAFLERVADSHREGAIYRGHANRSWSISPAAFRRNPQIGIKSNLELRKWKKMAARFAQRPMSDLEWIVLAQHYGVPTTLLDWTTNPLVALYFACQPSREINSMISHDGGVYMISQSELPTAPRDLNWDPFGEYSGPPQVVDTLAMNKRTLAQDSVMTLHSESTSIWTTSLPEVFNVTWHSKHSILQALKSMGISSDRIFVDLNVTAREFTEELHSNALWASFSFELPAPQ